MEGQVYQCPGCFTTIPADCIDFKTRRATCPSCGNLVVLTRKALNRSNQVVHDLENAVRFFLDNNFDSAMRYAESALSVAVDNVAALFIIAYYEAYVAETKTRKHIEKFFYEELPEIDCDYDELEMFKTLIKSRIVRLADFEKPILKKLSQTQSSQDLAEFVDAFSPYVINGRNSMDYLDEEMTDIYSNITMQTNIPKTWFSLYQSLTKNPDSPEVRDSYFLEKKTARFYNEYLLRVGKIFERINDATLKAKFYGAYNKVKEMIESKMK